jgi:hypothetical protein
MLRGIPIDSGTMLHAIGFHAEELHRGWIPTLEEVRPDLLTAFFKGWEHV